MTASRRKRDGTGGGGGRGWAVAGMVALAVASLLGLAAVAVFRDEPLDPAPDLAWEPTDWPEEANGAALLMGLAERRWFISGDQDWLSRFLRPSEHSAQPWDGVRASRILDDASAHLAALDRLGVSAVIAIPAEARGDCEARSHYIVSTGRQMRHLSDLGFLRAWRALKVGEQEGARASIESVITLNRRVLDGSESTIQFLYGVGNSATLAGQVDRLIDAGLVPDAALQEALAALADPAVFDHAWERSLKASHAEARALIPERQPFDPAELESGWGLLPRIRPNRSVNLDASMTRDQLAGVGLSYSEMGKLASVVVPLSQLEELMATNFREPPLDSTLKARAAQSRMYSLTKARLSLALTHIALRRHHLDHGRLPATLDELVPAYLEAVPTDWGDGGTVRYDPARRVIWGVGKNLADDGGDPGAKDDLCVVLGWLESSEAGFG
jgi:hypothetical protein